MKLRKPNEEEKAMLWIAGIMLIAVIGLIGTAVYYAYQLVRG